jgi:hypothetical protein
MKKILILTLLTLFLLSPVLSLKAAGPPDPVISYTKNDVKLRWADDKMIYEGTVRVDAWAVANNEVEDESIDVDYFAGDTLRAVVACPDSTVRILRSNDQGQTWSQVVIIMSFNDYLTEPHIVHGPDSTYHVFVRSLYNQDEIYTYAFRTGDDQTIPGTAQSLSGADSVKNYSVCTDRRSNHAYSVYLAYHQGNGGRGADQVKFTRTTDQGQSWSSPAVITSIGGSGYPDITYGNDSTLYLAYLIRMSTGNNNINIRRSLNNGENWQFSGAPQVDSFPKMAPQIAAAYDDSGDVWVIWPRKNLLAANEDWDLYWSWSQNEGVSWSTAATVNSVTDSNDYFASIAVNDCYGSTSATPFVSFLRAYYDGSIPLVRSFTWSSGSWSSDTCFADTGSTVTRPIQTFYGTGDATPAIAYVGEGAENVYFDSWANASGIDEDNIASSIECSLDKSIIAGTATLKYTVKEAGKVRISMFNILGQEVATLLDGVQESGENTLTVSSENLPQGIYYIIIKSSTGTGTAKATIIK